MSRTSILSACSTPANRCNAQVAVYNGVREILSVGEKAKHASSRKKNNKRRRRSSSSKPDRTTNIGASAGGDGSNSLGTEDPNQDDGGLRDPPREDDSRSAREDLPPPRGEEGGGRFLDPDAPLATRAATEIPGGQNDDAAVGAAASSVLGGSGRRGDGCASGTETGARGGIGEGGVEFDGKSNPFALLSPDVLSSFDIVLTTFEVLRAEVHHAESRFAGGSGDVSSARGATSRPSLRRKKRRVNTRLACFVQSPEKLDENVRYPLQHQALQKMPCLVWRERGGGGLRCLVQVSTYKRPRKKGL